MMHRRGTPIDCRNGTFEGMDYRVRAAQLAFVLATVGALVPLVMMVDGSLRLDIDYKWWTWPAIPAVWLPAIAGAVIALRHPTRGALLLGGATAIGVGVFWREYGALTFGLAWLLSLYIYVETGRRRGYFSSPLDGTSPGPDPDAGAEHEVRAGP